MPWLNESLQELYIRIATTSRFEFLLGISINLVVIVAIQCSIIVISSNV